MGNLGPKETWMLAGGVFLDALLYYQWEGHWVLEIHEPFHSCSISHDIWYLLIFLSTVWCLRNHYVALSSGFHVKFPPCFPFTKGDDSDNMVPDGVGSDGHVLGVFVPLPPAVVTGLRRKQSFRWTLLLAELCFSVLCSSGFTHGTKAAWFQGKSYQNPCHQWNEKAKNLSVGNNTVQGLS